jgi:PIN domain nuclease of toxin-antitoxin system
VLNLDTHILLYALDNKLTGSEKRILAGDCWGISAIVLWEIEMLHRKRRIQIDLGTPPAIAALAKLHIWPITREICVNRRVLDFQSDPADELIASTSYTFGVPLMTRDGRLRASQVIRCIQS